MNTDQMKSPTFLCCPSCGNLAEMIQYSGVKPLCCGKEMIRMESKTSEEGHEKHLPIITREGCTITVKISDTPHPMTAEHHIDWVELITSCGMQRKPLKAGCEPAVCFHLSDKETPLAVFAYCNVHGLWVTEL